jgi:hypothetical protein
LREVADRGRIAGFHKRPRESASVFSNPKDIVIVFFLENAGYVRCTTDSHSVGAMKTVAQVAFAIASHDLRKRDAWADDDSNLPWTH